MLLPLLFALSIAAPAAAGELAERDEVAQQVLALAWRAKFAGLEAMAESFRSEGARSSSGLWRLSHFYAGLGKYLDSCANSCEATLIGWEAHYPDSPTPYLARADHFITLAWRYRGNGPAARVTDAGWKGFHANIAKARQVLEAHKEIAARDPAWYSMMLTVALAQGWPERKFSALVDEGLDRAPGYYPIYFKAVEYHAPKWHGDAAAIERFARAAVERTRAGEGLGLYARVYWYASGIQFDQALFEESDVVWADMKTGIDDVLKHYPDQWNINNFAYFACLAGDHDKARELAARIEGAPDPVVWDRFWRDERCGV